MLEYRARCVLYMVLLAIARSWRHAEQVFLGLSKPLTAPVWASWTGLKDWMGSYCAEHDLECMNALLDEVSLSWTPTRCACRPDGKSLVLEAQRGGSSTSGPDGSS